MPNNLYRRITSIAPARVCLFGDHQDYLGLPIIACAINRFINVEGVKNQKEYFDIQLPDIDKQLKLNYGKYPTQIAQGHFLQSALKILMNYGCQPNCGYDITISGNIPINSGLSSSSALVVAWIRFLIETFGIDRPITPELIAKLAYEAEVKELNSSGGKMDQYTIAIGNVIYLETDTNSCFEKLIAPKMTIIIGDSGVPKATGMVLSELKQNTYRAINHVRNKFQNFKIHDAKVSEIPNYLKHIPDNLKTYFEAAILNHDITKRALVELRKEKFEIEKIGTLMNEHHTILKDFLDLTVPKIDAMVDNAKSAGALGAKIVGSGRGGSIVAITNHSNTTKIINAIKEAGAIDAYEVAIVEGVRILKS